MSYAYRDFDLTLLFYAKILISHVDHNVCFRKGVNYYRDWSMSIPKSLATIERQSEIHDEIRSLYLSGVPLFTKEQIYAVRQQIKELGGKCGKVLVTSLNGNVAEFVLNWKAGHVLSSKIGVEYITYV